MFPRTMQYLSIATITNSELVDINSDSPPP